ncbi:MAG: hypothetical protein ABEJ28_08940 [Salinigranum sp.]
MQQQQPAPQQQYQPSQFGQQLGQRIGQRLVDTLQPEAVQAVQQLERVETLSEFAKAQAIQKGMPRVARACDDIQDIAHVEKKLILRQSPAAQTLGQCVQQAVQERVQNLQQRAGEPEVQEALQEAQQSISHIGNAISRLQTFGQQGMQSQQYQQPWQ